MGGCNISFLNGIYTDAIQDVAGRMNQPKNAPARPQAEGTPNAVSQNAPGDVVDKITRLLKNFPIDKGAVKLGDLAGVKKALPKALKVAYWDATILVRDAQKSLNAVGKLTGCELVDACRLYGAIENIRDEETQLRNESNSLKQKVASGQQKDDSDERQLEKLQLQIGEVERAKKELEARCNAVEKQRREDASQNWYNLKAAINDQRELSAKLLEMINAATDDTVKEMLETLMIRADSRASELSSLILQMGELAEEDEKQIPSPDIDKIMGCRTESLMAKMSVAMHDNLEAAAVLVSDDNLGVDTLVESLEKLNGDTSPMPEKAEGGRFSQDALINQIKDVEGSLNKSVKAMSMNAPLARCIVDAATAGCARIKDKAKVTARQKRIELHHRLLGDVMKAFYDVRQGRCWEHFKAKSKELVAFDRAFENLLTSSEDLADEPSKGNIAAFQKAKKNFLNLTGLDGEDSEDAQNFRTEIKNLFSSVSDDDRLKILGTDNMNSYDLLILGYLGTEVDPIDILFNKVFASDHTNGDQNTLVEELGQFERYVKQMTEDAFESVFAQNGVSGADFRHLILNQPLSGVIEARVYGENASVDMFETECLDEFITEKEKIGEGKANTAWRVTYTLPSGKIEKRIFKDEISDYVGSGCLGLAQCAWMPTHQMVKLNYAAAETAGILGTPHAVVRVKAAMCQGAYGLSMSVASGHDARTLKYKATKGQADDAAAKMLAKIIKDGYSPDDPAQRRFVGSHAKGSVDLVWNDLVTGQGDRHDANYFVDMANDGQAVVTGIDNDMCFPAYKTGIRTYRLEGSLLNRFEKQLLSLYNGENAAGKTDAEKIAEILKEDKVAGIHWSDDGLEITITSETPANIQAALHKSLGIFNGAALPHYISQSMRDNLMNADKQNQLKDCWKKTLDNASYEAAVSRLKEIVDYVSKMDPKHILADEVEAWGDPEVLANLVEKPVVKGENSSNSKTETIVAAKEIFGNLLERDFGDIYRSLTSPVVKMNKDS